MTPFPRLVDEFAVAVGFLFEECNATREQILRSVADLAELERTALLSAHSELEARVGELEGALREMGVALSHAFDEESMDPITEAQAQRRVMGVMNMCVARAALSGEK